MSTSQISTQLLAMRQEAGLSRAKAAALIGVNEATVYRWEVGTRQVKAADRDRAMAAYAQVIARRRRLLPTGTERVPGVMPTDDDLSPLSHAVSDLMVRVERELLRSGADDFAVDHLRRAVALYLTDRAGHGVPAPLTGAEVAGDEDLARYLGALRNWVLARMAARLNTKVVVGRRPGVRVDREVTTADAEASPPRKRAGKR